MNQIPKEFQQIVLKERGMFADGDGLNDHDTVAMETTRQGAEFSINCDCGSQVGIGIPWFELVALTYGVSPAAAFQRTPQVFGGQPPTPWVFVPDQNGGGVWKIRDFTCKACKVAFPFGLSLSEPKKLVERGRRIPGAIPNEAQLSQIADQASKAMRGGGGAG